MFYILVDFYLSKPITVIGFAVGRTENGGEGDLSDARPFGRPRRLLLLQLGGVGIDFNYLRGLHMSSPSRVVPMGLAAS
ncbi:MAG: hypothetical protein ABWK05_04250 [Pyrobaculum sp.]